MQYSDAAAITSPAVNQAILTEMQLGRAHKITPIPADNIAYQTKMWLGHQKNNRMRRSPRTRTFRISALASRHPGGGNFRNQTGCIVPRSAGLLA